MKNHTYIQKADYDILIKACTNITESFSHCKLSIKISLKVNKKIALELSNRLLNIL